MSFEAVRTEGSINNRKPTLVICRQELENIFTRLGEIASYLS
jgi:hypothetical protein